MTALLEQAFEDKAQRTRENLRKPEVVKNAALMAIQDRLVRRPEVEDMTGLSRSTIYDWMKRGDFPKPIRLGSRLVAWRESDLSEWLSNREAA